MECKLWDSSQNRIGQFRSSWLNYAADRRLVGPNTLTARAPGRPHILALAAARPPRQLPPPPRPLLA
ncbi:MAG: hypothetical protein ACRECU_07475, partial [Methylocella sp.]